MPRRTVVTDTESGKVLSDALDTAANSVNMAANTKETDTTDNRGLALVLRQLEEQYSLEPEQQKKLIISDGPMMAAGLELAVRTAKSYLLPLTGINLLAGKVYVNSDGVRWRLHTDPRGVLRSEADVTHLPTAEEPYVMAKATIEMGPNYPGGPTSTYVNYGVVQVIKPADIANAIMKCVTKSKRRCGVDAVGVALPIFEDFVEAQEEITRFRPSAGLNGMVVEGESRVLGEGLPTTLPTFLEWAQTLGYTTPAAILQALGLDSWTAVTADLAGAVAKLQGAQHGV